MTGVSAFWAWWGGAAPRLADAIARGTLGSFADEVSQAVATIHPELAWEFSAGKSARHGFSLSAEGKIVLRRLAERWLGGAPPPDETWEYYASRQPGPEGVLQLAGQKFDSREWRFATNLDDGRLLLDVMAYHPSLRHLAQKARPQAGFVAIDQIFGEDAVEKWFGRMEFVDRVPKTAEPASDVFRTLERMADESKKEVFTLAQGHDDRGRPLFLSFNQRLKLLEHLFAEAKVQLDVPFLQPTERGLPIAEENRRLDEFEDHLLEAAKGAVYVGRLTGAGRRSWFFYAGNGQQVGDALEASVKADQRWSGHATWEPDPEWSFYRQGIYAGFRQ